MKKGILILSLKFSTVKEQILDKSFTGDTMYLTLQTGFINSVQTTIHKTFSGEKLLLLGWRRQKGPLPVVQGEREVVCGAVEV